MELRIPFLVLIVTVLNYFCEAGYSFTPQSACPSNCRCVASQDGKAKYDTVYNDWVAQKMYRYSTKPGSAWQPSQGREMTCLGLLSVPSSLPSDLFKLQIYGGKKGLINPAEENVYSDEPVTERDRATPSYQITTLPTDAFWTTPALVDLVITGNKIVELTDVLTPLRKLENLSLRKNHIQLINSDSLRGLDRLRTLDLAGNYIMKIPAGFFRDTVNLENVKLGSNQIGIQGVHRDTFITLFRIRVLDLSDNKLRAIHPDIFRGNRLLEELNLSKNKLRTVERGWFWSVPKLQKLNLEGNLLLIVQGVIFKPLRLLKELNLSGNKLSYVHRNVFLPLPKLQKLDISNNNIHHLASYTFADLSGLSDLNMEKNKLKKISIATFVGLRNLHRLNMAHNNLKSVPKEVYLPLKSVRRLDLSNNGFKSLKSKAFFGMHNIRELNLDNNDIKNISKEAFTVSWVRHYSRLVWLSLQNNGIQFVDPEVFRTAPHVKHLDLGHNKIYHIDDKMFTFLADLSTLKMEYNQLSELTDATFRDQKKLQLLNLAENKLLYVPAGVFSSLASVQEIDLSNNRIMSIPESAFKNASKLVHIDISGNNLRKLRMKMFEENRNLRRLNAGNSSLSEIVVEDMPPYKLDYLDLAGNKIKTLDSKLVSWLAPNSTLQLGANPLTCDCTVSWIPDAIQSQFLTVPDHQQMICKKPIWTAGKLLSQMTKNELICIIPKGGKTPRPLPRPVTPTQRRQSWTPWTPRKIDVSAHCKNPKRMSRRILEEWHATIFDAQRRSICAGVRVSDNFILTHASCWRFSGIRDSDIQRGRILIKTGSERDRRTSHAFRAKKVIYHPNMAINSRSEYKAIALVEVEAVRPNSQSRYYPCIADPTKRSTKRRFRAPHYFLTAKSETVKPRTRIKLRTITTRGVRRGACDGIRYACTKSLLRAMPAWRYLTVSSPLYQTRDLGLLAVRSMRQTPHIQTFIGLYDMADWIYGIIE